MDEEQLRQQRQQGALADAWRAAKMRYQALQLAEELAALTEASIHEAAAAGVPQVLIAEAVGVSRGRVSQVLKTTEATEDSTEISERVSRISNYPGDAMDAKTGFPGHMTYPPYPKRRDS